MVATTNLISYWKLDEASGDADDAHGSNDGTVTGATYGATGKIDDAYSFDGTADYVNLGTTTTLFGSNPDTWSYNVWFKSSSGNDQHIMSSFTAGGTAHTGVIRLDTSGDINGHLYNGSAGTDLIKVGSYADNAWHMVTITISKTADEFKLYVDGTLEDSGTTPNSASDYTNSAILYLGKYAAGADFIGTIDEASIWDDVLSSTDVSDLYNSGSGLAYPFVGDQTSNPATLALSTAGPILNAKILAGAPTLSLIASIPSPSAYGYIIPTNITIGTGSLSSRYISKNWPIETGLDDEDKHVGRVINLVAEQGSNVRARDKVLL